ncbi:MAG: LytTR family transcriptional regulator [Bacteroidales bacterium]|nr:LytTR family transcriptional regulator [Bacteroidales bacterium]
MLEFFKKPYPFNNDLVHNAKVVFFIGAAIGLFLFFFEPFNFNNFSLRDKFIVSSLISLITFAVLSFSMIIIPSFFKSFFSIKNWNVLKEIFWNTWLIFTLIVGYYFYFRFNSVFLIKPGDILKIILISFLAISILVVLNRNRLVKIHLNLAVELNKKLMTKMDSADKELLFESEYKKDSIKLTVKDIAVIKSAGNYVEFFYFENSKIKKHLLRNTLINIEDTLKNYNFIFRCHRTYLINTDFIIKATGDSQGVKLLMRGLDFQVPVSRNYLAGLKEKI